jgi:prevent-host-death family protein
LTLFNVHAAKTHLSRLIEQAAAGEEIVIARAGKPVTRLVPYEPRREPRQPGLS